MMRLPQRQVFENQKKQVQGTTNNDLIQCTLKEICITEQEYLKDLEHFSNYFINLVIKIPMKHVNIEVLKDYFDKWTTLIPFHQMLVNDFTALMKSPSIDLKKAISILKIYVPFLGTYSNYAIAQPQFHDIIHNLIGKSKEFKLFCEIFKYYPRSNGNDVLSFAIKPIQRLLKYPIFISSISKLMIPTNENYSDIQTVYKAILKSSYSINESRHKHECLKDFQEIKDKSKNFPSNNLPIPQGEIYKGSISLFKSSPEKMKTYNVNMFNNFLIITKHITNQNWKIKHIIPLDSSIVINTETINSLKIINIYEENLGININIKEDENDSLLNRIYNVIQTQQLSETEENISSLKTSIQQWISSTRKRISSSDLTSSTQHSNTSRKLSFKKEKSTSDGDLKVSSTNEPIFISEPMGFRKASTSEITQNIEGDDKIIVEKHLLINEKKPEKPKFPSKPIPPLPDVVQANSKKEVITLNKK